MHSKDLYIFKDNLKYQWWSVHTSYRKSNNFERMEFLGDRLIASTLTKYLIHNFQSINEKQLNERLSYLVCGNTMSSLCSSIIQEVTYSGSMTMSMRADILESFIGAIYIDSQNIQLTEKIILHLWKKLLKQEPPRDYKNLVQIYLQQRKIDYEYFYQQDSNRIFICDIVANNMQCYGKGKSKSIASYEATKKFWYKYLS